MKTHIHKKVQKQDNSLKRAIIDADLIARCDNVLARLRGTPTSTVRQELLSNIHGSRSRPRLLKDRKLCGSKFYCLASVDSTQVLHARICLGVCQKTHDPDIHI